MNTPSAIRKVYQGIADRHQMFRMFNRHAQRSHRFDGDASAHYAGEWFEISEREHDYMFEILPPLWIRGTMFAMREFLTGSVTSVFFSLRIDRVVRHFHGYCDLSDGGSVEQMRLAIIERETRPVRAMTRDERLEHIWSATSDAYRGYSDESSPYYLPGHRVITLYSEAASARSKLLDDLTDDEIASKLPVQLRHLPDAAVAA
ncbi:DUF1419 domain-containing protein (plasmid) [Rhizobium rhizogenes]|uniref:DUF1419 domain-containing protein n=1 Tax=Rhizobium rhizogenes TaxID=359 RepID=UPI0015716DE4|nr:DUF1419 domain-containing protein [Rhizobium rhizogenes]NTI26564.1 DUF1419 domain-containing protein [Rhizobium rhizogenes]QTG10291.1 DUF1419 domain-containing protein [Rhizobium rhizogenes]